MKEINFDKIRELQLEMLVDFAAFCDKNNYTYWLSGGTLLGAVRHKGFIPWDDDIDIMMPRDDYEKAIKNYSHKRFKMDSILIDDKTWVHFARINDTYTEVKGCFKPECKEYVFIDIFPIEGLPNNKILQKLGYVVEKILLACHSASVMQYKPSSYYNDRDSGAFKYKYYMRTGIKYLLITAIGWVKPYVWARLIDNFAKRYSFQNAKMAGCMISGPHGSKEIMEQKTFCDKILMDFEGLKFWGLKDYDTYLAHLYGDYMKLPPKNKQVRHHDFVGYIKE